VPERAEKPALAIHSEIPRRPNCGQADITGKDGVRCGAVADRFGDLLWMNNTSDGVAFSEIIKLTARHGIVSLRPR
jgi:hypothetical protein